MHRFSSTAERAGLSRAASTSAIPSRTAVVRLISTGLGAHGITTSSAYRSADFGFRRRPARPRVGLCDGVTAQVNRDRFVMADVPVVTSRLPTLAGQAMFPISSPRGAP